MTISNSIDFSVTATDIVNEALSIIGALGEGEDANTAQMTTSLRTLNMMTKHWQAEGLNLFAVDRFYLFLNRNRERYNLDHFTSSTDPEITRLVTDYRNFSSTGTAAAAQAVISLPTGFSQQEWEGVPSVRVGDAVGVAYTDAVFWSTITAITVDSITLADVLPTAVESGTVIFTYNMSNRAGRPMKLMEAYVRDTENSNVDVPIGVISRRRYDRLSIKNTRGQVNQVYFDPQPTTAELNVWPVTDDVSDVLVLQVQRTLSDLDSGTNTPDYPQEWYLPLAWGLAELEAVRFGVPPSERSFISQKAMMLKEEATGFDEELYTSVYFTVDSRGEEL